MDINIIKNNQIDITESEWIHLNENYSKDDIKIMISNAIRDNDLKMPMRDISIEDAKDDYNKLLAINSSELIIDSKWFSRYDDDYDSKWVKIDKIVKTNTCGNKASDYFVQSDRWMCDSINAPSPYRSWNIEKFRLTLLNALWSLKVKKVNNSTLRSCIGLRKYIASQFRTSSAKSIYNYFNTKNVLDFSSGLGDRLTGFMASDALTYTGIDPNENLIDKYQSIIDTYNTSGKKLK